MLLYPKKLYLYFTLCNKQGSVTMVTTSEHYGFFLLFIIHWESYYDIIYITVIFEPFL